MFINRTLIPFLLSASKSFPVLMLSGARQVGKTTLLQSLREDDRKYVTLDDPMALQLAREDPGLFLQRFEPPLLIDEIQYAPGLFPHIKMFVDQHRLPGQFWLTGSQPFQLMRGISESLAGRIAVVRLLGFSRREQLGYGETSAPFLPRKREFSDSGSDTLSLMELYRMIWRGSLPAVARDDKVDRNLFFSSYVQTYLQRDIRDLARVGDETAFLRFLKAAASRTGQLLNLASLARAADIAPNTAKNWLSILETSGIVYLLKPYFTNFTKRLVKTPKLYFLDTGLCAYLCEWSSPETLEAGAMSGAILETWIFAEILRSYWHNGQDAPLYFFRDKDKKEIDILIVKDGTIFPVEIKKSAAPDKKAIRQFSALNRIPLKIGDGAVICLCSQRMPLSPSIDAIPVTEI